MTPARIILGSLLIAVALSCAILVHTGVRKVKAEHYPAAPNTCMPNEFCLGARLVNGE